MNKYRQFLKLYLWITTVMALPLFINLLFITNAHEHTTYGEIVKIQQAKNAIYGTALNQNTFAYKIELVRNTKPKIIALGSSRVLELREEFFNASFVNCGGAMNNLEEGKVFLAELFRHHKPEVLILGLDFWWFSDGFSQRENFDYHRNTGADLTLDKLIKPYDFLVSSKINLRDYLQILLFKNDKNHITNYNNLGLTAIKRSDGFRKDGSYLYANTIAGFAPEGQRITGFNDKLDPKRRFEFGPNLSQGRINALIDIIEMCIHNSVMPVMIIPPVTTMAYQRIITRPEKYGYVFRFQEYVKSIPFETYDFHDIKKAGSNDCECIDGFHIGDVAYQRILLKILNQNQASVISGYVNASLIERMVREHEGKVMTVFETDRGRFNYKETDFLKLGCQKDH
jgi:hypothetical protein